MPISGNEGAGSGRSEEDGQIPDTSNHAELLRAYLAGAPEELADWAGERLAELDSSEPVESGRSATEVSGHAKTGSDQARAKADEAATEGAGSGETEPEEADESDDFYNDMEGEDDLVHDRIGKKRNRGDGAKAAQQPSDRLGGKSKVLLAIVLVVGVIGGVYVAGRGGDETPSATTPTMNATAEDTTARKAELTEAIEENPEAIDERLELGVLYFNDRDIEQAQEQWLTVIDLEPEEVAAWYNLGFSYLSEDPADTEAAYDAWQRVIDIDPDSQEAQTVMTHMEGLTDQGESSEE